MMPFVNVGDVVAGKYRVESILGVGGMGMVVAALHLDLDQRVALKFMLPELMASEQAVARFLREAKSAVKLRSQHICRVLDVGRSESGAPYIVMEFLDGVDFGKLLQQRGRLSTMEVCEYVLQAIEALAEAHANGIVHRDLKPGNLFVTRGTDGVAMVKVLDFGIAKSSIGGLATKTGDMMGSPAFMAPEQMASSKDVDARADIWALGVILYQAITGTLPFDADSLPALCMKVLNEQPRSPDQVCGDIPGAFAEVVMRCLAKTPDHRYADVSDLAAALVPYCSTDVAAGARRSARILGRSEPRSSIPAHANAPTPRAVSALAQSNRASPVGVGAASTLQSVASESRPASTKRRGAVAIAVAFAVAIGVAGGVFALRHDNEPVTPRAPVAPSPSASQPIETASPVVPAVVPANNRVDPTAPPDAAPAAPAVETPVDAAVIAIADASPSVTTAIATTTAKPEHASTMTVKAPKDNGAPRERKQAAAVSAPPAITPPPVSVPDALDRTMIHDGVVFASPAIAKCGEKWPSRGRVKVSVKVDPDGHVLSATIVGDPPDAGLGHCVVGIMSRTTFAPTQHGGAFSYPFDF